MNPFILSTYLSPEYFCDRGEETKRLMTSIENNRNTTLIAQRRMGKSGLLKHLEYINKNNSAVQFVYFDIMTTSNAAEFVKLFADSIFRSYKSKIDSYMKNFSRIFSFFKPSFSLNPITGEYKFNIEINTEFEIDKSLDTIFNYLAESKKKFVIAIDEFQQITSYPEKHLEAALRSKIQFMNNTVFFFSGSSKEILNTMFLNRKRPFYLSGEVMYLDNISKDSYSEFIKKKFELGGKTINDESIDYLLDLVKVHTYYVQLLCNRIYSEDVSQISTEVIDSVYRKIIEENKYYFESYKTILTDHQWKLLQAIAKEQETNGIMSKEFIYKYKLGAASSVQTAVKSLEKKELIIKENNKYYLTDLLFAEWLRR